VQHSSNYHCGEWLNVDALPHAPTSSCTIKPKDFEQTYCERNLQDTDDYTRIELAKTIKRICQISSNREMILSECKNGFCGALNTMLEDRLSEIVHYALFTLNLFGSTISSFSGM